MKEASNDFVKRIKNMNNWNDKQQKFLDGVYFAHDLNTNKEKVDWLAMKMNMNISVGIPCLIGTDPNNPPTEGDILAVALYDLEADYLEKEGLYLKTYI